jgi:hypothetical protein
MKPKTLALMTLLAAACAWASAAGRTYDVPLVGPDDQGNFSAPIEVSHVLVGSFTDTFSFGTLARAADISGSLITFGSAAAQDIDFISAHLNGVPLSFTRTTSAGVPQARERGYLSSSPFAAGTPLVLTVTGLAGEGLAAGSALAASYGGTLTITPAIPEPGTYALLLAGLATVAWVARRRQP